MKKIFPIALLLVGALLLVSAQSQATSIYNPPATSGSGSSGTVTTSSAITANYFPFWSTTGGGLSGTSTIYRLTSGFVGIGTLVPSSTLHVVGTSTLSSAVIPLLYADSSNTRYVTSTSNSAYFVIESPTATEDDAFMVFDATSTITKVYAVNKTNGDTATFNLVYSSNRSASTSTAQRVFSSYQTVTATSTPTSLTSFASSTVTAGQVMRFVTSAASSSQFLVTIYYTN